MISTAGSHSTLIALLLVITHASLSAAQHHETDNGLKAALGASATGVVTRVSPAIMGRSLTEGYLTQPFLSAHAALPRHGLALHGVFNFEGLTLDRGELNPGIYGEGYVDRRHPHTYLHELMLVAGRPLRAARISLAAGKGFAPFGTDDPMTRPFVKYPVNHHLAQILERVVAVGAVRTRFAILEAGLFNGDEPETSGDAPNSSRLWDSWSIRGTALPLRGAELQASYARVRSPEHPDGQGLDNRKQSASLRYQSHERSVQRYLLVEWARTRETLRGRDVFAFGSALGEVELRGSRAAVALRLERTERPDEERLLDPFRTPQPGSDFNILGRSRWTTASARMSAPLQLRGKGWLEPFVEVARSAVRQTISPSTFEPELFYGADRMWSASAGLRMSWGMRHDRMGRYGAAIAPPRGMRGGTDDGDHRH